MSGSLGRLQYRDDPAASTYSVAAAWKRLTAWAKVHLPGSAESLHKPVKATHWKALEKQVGALPDDVRESYFIHDGESGDAHIMYGLQLLSAAEILSNWQSWHAGHASAVAELALSDVTQDDMAANCRSFPADFVRHAYFHNGWIPLTYDSGGNHIGIDLNPGPLGTMGQVIIFGRDDELHAVLARSWGQFLTDLADELEAGNFRVNDEDGFLPDAPFKRHFHSIGMQWSRAKLGLRRLKNEDRALWKSRGL